MDPNKNKWTARRIAALAGVILLVGMYASTLVFALIGGPNAQALLMGSVYCTIAVPILLYGMSLVAKSVRGKGVREEDNESDDNSSSDDPSDRS
uniref:hypothetical protein n=1 Tax=Eubacterium cellulosolvens TaxID=29322 RepID=UPI000485A38D|nr:hypothetical protein [[Eubacterium] cellulosolvens]